MKAYIKTVLCVSDYVANLHHQGNKVVLVHCAEPLTMIGGKLYILTMNENKVCAQCDCGYVIHTPHNCG
jgi:hypothetical protein